MLYSQKDILNVAYSGEIWRALNLAKWPKMGNLVLNLAVFSV